MFSVSFITSKTLLQRECCSVFRRHDRKLIRPSVPSRPRGQTDLCQLASVCSELIDGEGSVSSKFWHCELTGSWTLMSSLTVSTQSLVQTEFTLSARNPFWCDRRAGAIFTAGVSFFNESVVLNLRTNVWNITFYSADFQITWLASAARRPAAFLQKLSLFLLSTQNFDREELLLCFSCCWEIVENRKDESRDDIRRRGGKH